MSHDLDPGRPESFFDRASTRTDIKIATASFDSWQRLSPDWWLGTELGGRLFGRAASSWHSRNPSGPILSLRQDQKSVFDSCVDWGVPDNAWH